MRRFGLALPPKCSSEDAIFPTCHIFRHRRWAQADSQQKNSDQAIPKTDFETESALQVRQETVAVAAETGFGAAGSASSSAARTCWAVLAALEVVMEWQNRRSKFAFS